MKLRRQVRAGFTLIEIMVALTILALIVSAIYAAWFSILKGSTAAASAAATAQRTRLTMRLIEDAFLGAVMFNQNSRYYSFEVDAQGDYSSVSFVSRLPESFLRSRKFDGADIRRVSFVVEDGPGGEKQLVLRQNPLLLEPDKDEQENPLVVAHHVKLFLVEFIDPKTKDWTSDWPYTNQIPSEIRIQLALGGQDKFSDKPTETLVGVVAPLTSAVRPEWQMPAGQAFQPGPNGPNGPGQPPGNPPNT